MILLTALSIGLAGCTAATPDKVLKQAAEGSTEDKLIAVKPGTPRDSFAMRAARDQIERDLAGADVKHVGPPPAAPNAEQIMVLGTRSFAGNWRMVSPTTMTAHADRDATYEEVETFICRFDQHTATLSGACLPSRKRIEGTVEGTDVTLDWSRGLVSASLHGTLLSSTDFRGTLSIGALGITVPTDIPAYGSKLEGATEPQEIDRIAGQLLEALIHGEMPPDRYTPAALTQLQDAPLFSERDKHALGLPIEQFFLDRIAVAAKDEGPRQTMAVYDVTFEQGWRLCGVILDDAQKIDRVDCS